jgi:acyl-coenzyme A thioesterase PaaI-like protein
LQVAAAQDGCTFEIGPELQGAFGGAFGGAVAAGALAAARTLADGRAPAALDINFLRRLPSGTARARATVLRSGKSLTFMSVDVLDADGDQTARATVTFVDPAALDPREPAAHPAPAILDAVPWRNPAGVSAPIIETLQPRVGRTDDGGVACIVTLPWDDPAALAEAACFAGDLCVGPSVVAAMAGRHVGHPNPDVSLRFLPRECGREVTGVARLEGLTEGLAVQTVRVYDGSTPVAAGASMSLLIAR